MHYSKMIHIIRTSFGYSDVTYGRGDMGNQRNHQQYILQGSASWLAF